MNSVLVFLLFVGLAKGWQQEYEEVLLVGGKMRFARSALQDEDLQESNVTVDTHLAQYTIGDRAWTTQYEPSLFIYGDRAGSGVEVLALVKNKTAMNVDEVIVAGQFDSISEESQSQYCSLGKWLGMRPRRNSLLRVGEGGLCSRASDPATLLATAAIGSDGDLFVGGSFSTRIWDGAAFIVVKHLARFESRRNLWVSLDNGPVGFLKGSNLTNHSHNNTTAAVLALAYSKREGRLFVGGRFNALAGGKQSTSAGLVEWTEDGGLASVSGGGLSRYDRGIPEVSALALDAANNKLYVAGIFDAVGASECSTLAEYAPGTPARLVFHHTSSTRRRGLRSSQSASKQQGKNRDFSQVVDDDHFVLSTDDDFFTSRNITTTNNRSSHTPSGYWKLEPGFGGTWKCILPATHRMDVIGAPVRLLLMGDSLYLAGRAAESSSWWTTANKSASAAIARYSRFFIEQPPAASGFGTSTDASSSDTKHFGSRRRSRARRLHPVNENIQRRRLTGSQQQQRSYYAWEWLPGWRGLNGTILTLAAGTGTYDGCVFVGGEFGQEPPLVVWRHDDKLGPYTRRFFSISGRVTAVSMALAAKPTTSGSAGIGSGSNGHGTQSKAKRNRLAMWRILKSALTGLGSACGAALLLILLARYGCVPGMIHFRKTLPPSAMDGAHSKNGISLKMLSYGSAPDLDLEFSEAYERAMRARHLDNRNTLVMIDPAEIVLHDIIGEGSFGRVWSATWQTSAVAVKEFVLAQAACAGGSMHRKDIIEEIVGEAGIMAYLRHPKILQLYGCSLTAQAIWIVSELCTYGSLRQVLDDVTIALPIELRLRMAIDVAEGMLYLHTRNSPIVHRDLKSHNLFVVDQNGFMKVRIGDWGSARAVAMSPNFSRTMTHGVGTTCWLAPELIKEAKGSERIDVYAFGIVLWELATREEVYAALSATQIIHRVSTEGMRPPLPPGCPWNQVMESCWSEDPAERPDFEQILAQLIHIYEDYSGHHLPPDGDNFVRLRNRANSDISDEEDAGHEKQKKKKSVSKLSKSTSDLEADPDAQKQKKAPVARLYSHQRRRNSDNNPMRHSHESVLNNSRGRSDPRSRGKATKASNNHHFSRNRAHSEHAPRRVATNTLISSSERDRLLGRLPSSAPSTSSFVPSYDNE